MTFPRSLLGALACAGYLAIPASARALDTRQLYDVSIFRGAVPIPVGQIIFLLLAESPTACQYNYEWDNALSISAGQLSAQGFFDETKVAPHLGCTGNALVSFSTNVQPTGGLTSSGFDRFQQFREIFAMTLGEAPSGHLDGAIQFTPAVSVIFGIGFVPAGPAPPPPPLPPPPAP